MVFPIVYSLIPCINNSLTYYAAYLFQLLVFLVPSVFMGVLLLLACVLLIIVGICICRQKPKSQGAHKKRSDSKKSDDKKSLNFSLSTSL